MIPFTDTLCVCSYLSLQLLKLPSDVNKMISYTEIPYPEQFWFLSEHTKSYPSYALGSVIASTSMPKILLLLCFKNFKDFQQSLSWQPHTQRRLNFPSGIISEHKKTPFHSLIHQRQAQTTEITGLPPTSIFNSNHNHFSKQMLLTYYWR